MPRGNFDNVGGSPGGSATRMGQTIQGGSVKRPPTPGSAQRAQAQAKAAKRKALVKKVGTGLAIGGGVAGYLARENAIKDAEAKKQKEREKLNKQSPSAVDRQDKLRYEKVVDRIKKGK